MQEKRKHARKEKSTESQTRTKEYGEEVLEGMTIGKKGEKKEHHGKRQRRGRSWRIF